MNVFRYFKKREREKNRESIGGVENSAALYGVVFGGVLAIKVN